MTYWPRISVLLLTYSNDPDGPRAFYAQKTLDAVMRNLGYSGELALHIADDGSPEEHRTRLVKQAADHFVEVTISNSARSGYGANYNLATQIIHDRGPLALPLEDDWELTHPLNVDAYAEALLSGAVRSVRLGYLSHTQPLRAELIYVGDKQYLLFDPDSAEPHINAGHPRLETVDYERSVGPWAEGINPGATEFDWVIRAEARYGVVWPLDAPPWNFFSHVGTIQARDDQGARVTA